MRSGRQAAGQLCRADSLNVHRKEHAESLVILLHGLRGSPNVVEKVRAATADALPDADIFVPMLPYGGAGLLTCATPASIVERLLTDVDSLWEQSAGRYRRIIIIGHSMGSMLARKLATLAHGERADAPFERPFERVAKRPWADRITRLVLLAGLTRGWESTSASTWVQASVWRFFTAVFETMPPRLRPFLLEMRAGAPFVIQTRLQWLSLLEGPNAPVIDIVQLLGTVDDIVAPSDMVDHLVDGRGPDTFVLLEMAHTDHLGAIDLAEPQPGHENSPAMERWRLLVAALTEPLATLARRPQAIDGSLLFDGTPTPPDYQVTDVVFVIHGIRDKGFWTQKIARAVKREAQIAAGEEPARVFRSMTLSYGYLAMAPFILPRVRRRKVAWLMDRYTEARAMFPNAQISYVGHSNGTYLAARALKDYPAARFHRIVFAGSVVRSDFAWTAVSTGACRRVNGLLNYVATGDLVVALFPGGLQPLRPFDLGNAGHRGFRELASSPPLNSGRSIVTRGDLSDGTFVQVNYVTGGHSAGIRESQWDEIARFIVHGEPPGEQNEDYAERQLLWIRAVGAIPTAVLLLLLALFIGIALILFAFGEWLLLLVYIALLLTILMKV
jgi:pimeloyl-ACP methyl ester carboxylesterase